VNCQFKVIADEIAPFWGEFSIGRTPAILKPKKGHGNIVIFHHTKRGWAMWVFT